MDDIEKTVTELKWEKFKMGVKTRFEKVKDWCTDHKEILMVVIPAVISGGVELSKAAIKAKDHKEDRELEDRRLKSVYDRSAGMYLETTRPLSNDDYRRLQQRKRDGMTTGEALDDMGLLR